MYLLELLRKAKANELIPQTFTAAAHRRMSSEAHIIVQRTLGELKKKTRHGIDDKMLKRFQIS